MALNGAIGGLVSITAEPLTPSIGSAVFIGAVGGVLVVLTVPLLDKLKVDDVVGAIPLTSCVASGVRSLCRSPIAMCPIASRLLE